MEKPIIYLHNAAPPEPNQEDKPQDEEVAPDMEAEAGQEVPEEGIGIVATILSMPDGLFGAFLKRLGLMLLAIIAGIIMMAEFYIPFKQAFFLFLGAGWMLWGAVSIVLDFHNGKIIERVLVCSYVDYHRFRAGGSRSRVVFSNNDPDNPLYFEYNLPGKKTREFIPHMVYLTYVREDTPLLLLAWKRL